MKNNKIEIIKVKIVYGMWKMCLAVNNWGNLGF